MLIGYARVSTNDQETAAQVAALKAGGCERIYREKASGGRWDRPELQRMLDHLRGGDTVVVWKLDRLSRSLKDLLFLMGRIGGRRRKLDAAKRKEIAESVLSGRKSGAEMARLYDVSQATASRIVAEYRIAGLKSHAKVRRSV